MSLSAALLTYSDPSGLPEYYRDREAMFLPPKTPDQEWLGVLIAIPEPWVSELTEARLALGDQAATKVPAHVTLIPPIAVGVAQREEILTHLQSIAAKFRPFRITVKGVGSFLPVSPVAFLDLVEGAAECADLADDLRTGPLDFSLRFPYHPHVTMVQGLDPERFDEVKNIGASFEATWTVPGFRLDQVAPDGMYTSRALFDFSL